MNEKPNVSYYISFLVVQPQLRFPRCGVKLPSFFSFSHSKETLFISGSIRLFGVPPVCSVYFTMPCNWVCTTLQFVCLATAVAVADPGDISLFANVQMASLGDMGQFLADSKNLNSGNAAGTAVLGDVKALYAVTLYTFRYTSTNQTGDPVLNTAALLVPTGSPVDKPTIIYNHGTVATDLEAPSSSRMCVGAHRNIQTCTLATSDAARASLWAMSGYSVVLPDYEKLGVGSTAGTHPYCQRESYEKSTFDLLKALVNIESNRSVAFNRRLVIAGYSEGGYATLAAYRAMMSRCAGDDSNSGFRVIAAFPYAGPFDIEFQVSHTLRKYLAGNYSGYWYVPYTIVAALEYYGKASLYPGVFKGSYASSVPPLYNGQHSVSAIEGAIPRNGSKGLFLPSVVQSFVSGSEGFSGDLQTFVVEKNKLFAPPASASCPSFSDAPLYFCSGTEDEQVPVDNTNAAERYFKGAGARTTLDLFPGDHSTNAGSCTMVLTHYLNTLDWNASAALPRNPSVAPYKVPFWVLGAIAGFLFLQFFLPTAINTYCRKYRKKKCECVGPFGVWVIIMTRVPIVVLVIGVAVPVYVSFLGFQASNFTIDVDSDFANYLSADTEMKRNLTAFEFAQTFSHTKHTPVKEARRRRLEKKYVSDLGGIDFFYEAKDESKGIFTKECLAEIKAFEDDVMAFSGYKDFCLAKKESDDCVIPLSPMNLFYGSSGGAGSGSGSGSGNTIYGGGGVLRNIDFVLTQMIETGVFWFTENDFGPKNKHSTLTRSHFDFGVKLPYDPARAQARYDEAAAGYKTWLKKLYEGLLDKTNNKYEHITVIYFEKSTLLDYEIDSALIHDSMWSLGSFAFVSLFVLVHLESPFLALFAMGSILLSFPAGYAVFYIYFGIKKMMLLNFVALFLIMGIGADDAFVLFDTYKQSEAVLGPGTSKIKRMTWAYKEAGSAMLVTTVTTAGSFYANCFSAVRVVKEFGLFMGTVVVWNYINVMVIFPSAILVWESCCYCFKWKVMGRCLRNCCCSRTGGGPVAPENALQSPSKWKVVRKSVDRYKGVRLLTRLTLKHGHAIDVNKLSAPEKCCHGCYTTWLYKCRGLVAILGVLLVVGAALLAQSSFVLASGTPTIFLDNRNLGRFFRLMKTKLAGTTPDDLQLASKAFPRSVDFVEENCPGSTVDGTVQCSRHGTCNEDTYKCSCHTGWAGDKCSETSIRASSPSFSKTTVSWNEAVTISSTNALRICYSTTGATACNLDGTCADGLGLTILEGTSGASNGLTITETTFRAIGCQNANLGHVHSAVVEVVVTMVSETVESPTFSPTTVSYGGTVSISSLLANYICYTTNNAVPVCDSPSNGIPSSCVNGKKILSGQNMLDGITANPTTVKAIGCPGVLGRLESPVVSEDIALVTVSAGDPTFAATSVHITDAAGSPMTLASVNAEFLCYEIHYAAGASRPACNAAGTGCQTGLKIIGASGDTQGLINSGTLYAVGCRNTAHGDQASAVASQAIAATYVVQQPLFSGSTSVVHGSKATIRSRYAAYICVSDTGVAPECEAPGTDGCITGVKQAGVVDASTNVLAVPSMGITSSVTLKATGCGLAGDTNSNASPGVAYTLIVATASDPVFTPTNGQLVHGDKVTIASDNAVSVCFTTDGAAPSCNADGTCNAGVAVGTDSTTTAFTVSTGFGVPLKAIGCANTGQSNVDSQITNLSLVALATEAVDPVFNPTGTIPGTLNFIGSMGLQITSADSSGVCYSTAGGQTAPTVPVCLGMGDGCSSGSFLANTPVPTLTGTTSISAVGCGRSAWQNSPQADSDVVTKVYTEKQQAGDVVFSVTAGSQGDAVALMSSNSTGVCYGVDNTVQCSGGGTGCDSGSFGNSIVLGTSTSTYYAMGCQDSNNGNLHGQISSQSITIVVTAGAPTFSGIVNTDQVLETTYPASATVTITSTDAENICYSTDGAIPASACSPNGECSAGFLTISGSSGATGVVSTAMTIKAVGCKAIPNLASPSETRTIANVLYRAQLPTFMGAGAVVSNGGTVPIQSRYASHVCYRIDGVDPSCASNGCGAGSLAVTDGVTQSLTADCTVRAIGCMDKSTLVSQEDSGVESHAITIQVVTAQPPLIAAQNVPYNSSLTITSTSAVSICYAMGASADTTTNPSCTNSITCASGTKIVGSSGATPLVTSAGVLKAVGCADSHSGLETISYGMLPTVATVPTIVGVDDAGASEYTVTIKSTSAITVCYGATSSSIGCSAAGSCSSGTAIVSTNDQVPTTSLGTYAYGDSLWAISCGRTSIAGSSDSDKVHRLFQAAAVTTTSTTAPPTTTTASGVVTTTTLAPAKACKNGCSGSGTCTGGVCECMKGYDRDDCSVKLVPLGDAVEFSLVFGVDGYDPKNTSLYSFKPDFDVSTLAAQKFLLKVCTMARADVGLGVRSDFPQGCWIQSFSQVVPAFPVSPAFFPTSLQQFMANTEGVFKGDVETTNDDYKGRLVWLSLRFRINAAVADGAFALQPLYLKWKRFLEETVNVGSPQELGPAHIVSAHFTSMDTEIAIIMSTVESFLISNGICLGAVLIFTGDLAISLYTMFAIMMIVVTLLGFLFGIMGFTFGAIEAVGVTIFVGMSVDYCLHLAHGYHHSSGKTRLEKVRDAMTHLGVSIVMGAITTGGAASFLLMCYLYLFFQLGVMMLMNTVLALFFSLVYLAAILAIAGPTNNLCYVYAWPRLCCRGLFCLCLKKGSEKASTAVAPVNDERDVFFKAVNPDGGSNMANDSSSSNAPFQSDEPAYYSSEEGEEDEFFM